MQKPLNYDSPLHEDPNYQRRKCPNLSVDNEILGIHHVTAIASDPQRNIDFYTGLLGLRLVKLTVNFDDPNSYHLYYGDEIGHPGTVDIPIDYSDNPFLIEEMGAVVASS